MFKIKKVFDFCASHQLTLVPEDHQCRRLHGHNYQVEVVLASDKLNGFGFVRDYHDMDVLAAFIKNELDHRDLNKATGIETTAENLAKWLYQRFLAHFPDELMCVRVSETPKTWAEYRP